MSAVAGGDSGGLPRPDSHTNRHAVSAVDKQRAQLNKLLKDPSKPAFVPPPPKEKTLRPPREMMKNVQGSSAGAGSGEFHVYKANRRREYERLKLMEDESQQEREKSEFELKKREREEQAEAKTAKNRAKRQKKKDRSVKRLEDTKENPAIPATATSSSTLKKRRLLNGKEIVFRHPGEGSDEDEADTEDRRTAEGDEDGNELSGRSQPPLHASSLVEADGSRFVIHDDE